VLLAEHDRSTVGTGPQIGDAIVLVEAARARAVAIKKKK